ncbi:hypothetical protein KAR91_21105, partial [Candidatus Pacearchaeota archaeon]|nr:hypothetical protein [Candidatus Pacearchaeota archaeon]
MGIPRRNFLKAMGGSAVVLSTTGVLGAVVPLKAPRMAVKALVDDEILDLSEFRAEYLMRCRLLKKDTLRNCKMRMMNNYFPRRGISEFIRLMDFSSSDLEELLSRYLHLYCATTQR